MKQALIQENKRSIFYFAFQFLGIPFSLTESNLKAYYFFGTREGYTIEELNEFIKR